MRRLLTRWLASEGKFGEVPEEYALVQAAKYLGVAPWDLAERPQWWTNLALTFSSAEAQAEKQRSAQKKGVAGANRR